MSDRDGNATGPRVALAVLSLVVLLYSLLITARPLLGAALVVALFGAYLGWRLLGLAVRFVVAFERIADAMEAQNR